LTEPYPPKFLNEQAKNTRSIREFLYQSINLSSCYHALDIGCGEGQITREFVEKVSGFIIGVDIAPPMIKAASKDAHHRLQYIVADAHHLPLKNRVIDFTQFHFVLMWAQDPSQVLQETKRVLVQGGVTIAVESDYSGRIENLPSYLPSKPKSSFTLVKMLKKMGADPFIGHKLPDLFHAMTFTQIKFGVLSWEYDQHMAKKSIQNDYSLTDESLTNDAKYGFTFTPVLWVVGTN
jgi:ubiquinone/menaquinone biosynthesis C-methylase UbiE